MTTLPRTALALFASVALAACGPATASTDAATHDDVATHPDDATVSPNGSGASDRDAAVTDATYADTPTMPPNDGAVAGATPPAGFALCGSAAFSATAVVTACNAKPSLPGALPYAKRCSAVTTHGGRYELWCPPAASGGGAVGQVYVWVVFDDAQATGTTCTLTLDDGFSAPLTTYPTLAGVRYVEASGAGSSDGDLRGAFAMIDTRPTGVRIDGLISAGSGGGSTGTLDLWIALTDEACPPAPSSPPYYAMGVAAAWSTPDR